MEQLSEMVSKIVANPFARIPFFLSIIAGAVGTIAIGFYLTFELVVTYGSRM
jgi:hypothetical protein